MRSWLSDEVRVVEVRQEVMNGFAGAVVRRVISPSGRWLQLAGVSFMASVSLGVVASVDIPGLRVFLRWDRDGL